MRVTWCLSFVAAFIDGIVGFEQQCEVTRMNMQYGEMISKVLVDHGEVGLEKKELSSLRPEIAEFKLVVEEVFYLRCLSCLYTLSCNSLDHPVDNLEGFEYSSHADAEAFEDFSELIKQS